jgi:hypothetical protein
MFHQVPSPTSLSIKKKPKTDWYRKDIDEILSLEKRILEHNNNKCKVGMDVTLLSAQEPRKEFLIIFFELQGNVYYV